jgi:hypothetical protein
LITENFDLAELDSLCFDMGMAGENFDEWQISGKRRRVEILLGELCQLGKIDKLLQLLRKERANGAWPVSAAELGSAPFVNADSLENMERRYLTNLVASCRDLKPYMDFGDGSKSRYFVQFSKVNVKRHVILADFRNLHNNLSESRKSTVPSTDNEKGTPRNYEGRTKQSLQDESSRSEPILVALSEVFQQNRNIVLLGRPGIGKSTAAQFFAMSHAENAQRKDAAKDPRIPILVKLRDWSDELGKVSLEHLLASEVQYLCHIGIQQSERLLNEWINAGRLFVILDGLDEVSSRAASSITDQLRAFESTLVGTACHILVTSRPVGYIGIGRTFVEYELQPLEGHVAVVEYVASWLSAIRELSLDLAMIDAEKLVSQIEANPGLRKGCADPLLLYLAIRLYDYSGRIEAGSRAEVLNLYINALWSKVAEKDTADTSLDLVLTYLAIVAWEIHLHGSQTFDHLIPAIHTTAPQSNAQEVLNLARKMGLLRDDFTDPLKVDFTHTVFRDFFVARRLKMAWEIDTDQTWFLIKPLLHANVFHEPLLILASIFSDEQANKFIKSVAEAGSDFEDELLRDLLLAAEMLTARSQVNADLLDQITRSIVFAYLFYVGLDHPDNAIRKQILDRIEAILKNLDETAYTQATYLIIKWAMANPKNDNDQLFRWRAITTIGKLRIKSPDVTNVLLEALKENSLARAAVISLGEVGPATDEVIFALLNASGQPGLTDRESGWIESDAVEALHRIGERNPQLAERLKGLLTVKDERLRSDKSYRAIAAALFRLAQTSLDAMRFVLRCGSEYHEKIRNRHEGIQNQKRYIVDQIAPDAVRASRDLFDLHDDDEKYLRGFKTMSLIVLRYVLTVIRKSKIQSKRWAAYMFLSMVMNDDSPKIDCREIDHDRLFSVTVDLTKHLFSILHYELRRETGNLFENRSEYVASRLVQWGLTNADIVLRLIKLVRKAQPLFLASVLTRSIYFEDSPSPEVLRLRANDQYAHNTEFRRQHALLARNSTEALAEFEAKRLSFLGNLCSTAVSHISNRVNTCRDVSFSPKLFAALLTFTRMNYLPGYAWSVLPWKELRKECALGVSKALAILGGETEGVVKILVTISRGEKHPFLNQRLEWHIGQHKYLRDEFQKQPTDDQRVAAAAGLAYLANTMPEAKKHLLSLIDPNYKQIQDEDERKARTQIFDALGYVDHGDRSIVEPLLTEIAHPEHWGAIMGRPVARLKTIDADVTQLLIQSFNNLHKIEVKQVRGQVLRDIPRLVIDEIRSVATLRPKQRYMRIGSSCDYELENVLKALGKVKPSSLDLQIETVFLEAFQSGNWRIGRAAVEQLALLPSPSFRVIEALNRFMWSRYGAAEALARAIDHLDDEEFSSSKNEKVLSKMAYSMIRNKRANHRTAMRHTERSWREAVFDPLSRLVDRLTQTKALETAKSLQLPPQSRAIQKRKSRPNPLLVALAVVAANVLFTISLNLVSEFVTNTFYPMSNIIRTIVVFGMAIAGVIVSILVAWRITNSSD